MTIADPISATIDIYDWMIGATVRPNGTADVTTAHVLATLAGCQPRDGSWFAHTDTEVSVLTGGIPTRTVRRARKRLVELGLIECGRRRVAGTTTMHYRMCVPVRSTRRRSYVKPAPKRDELAALLGGETVPAEGTWVVYRHYDADGTLLYVGRTQRFDQRHAGHRNSSPWWPTVHRISVKSFPTYERCAVAEALAIRADRPRWNKVGVR